jgi:hypothetical protein
MRREYGMKIVPRGAAGKAGLASRGRDRRRALAVAARWWPFFYAGWIVGASALSLFGPVSRWETTTADLSAAAWFWLYRLAARRADRAEARAAAQTPKVQNLIDPKGTTHTALWLSQN